MENKQFNSKINLKFVIYLNITGKRDFLFLFFEFYFFGVNRNSRIIFRMCFRVV